ncbi:MAG TPA: ROK family protein [Usitatibacter sp.]|nr:ROK family protein [Usitatibacter sp.]
MGLRIGVDLGGTKIEAAALDAAGRIALRRRAATPVGRYDATVQTIAELVESLEAELGANASVGVATPGARSLVDNRIKNSNSIALNGRALKEDLERRLKREIRMANDANCFALSEAIDGAARGASNVFGVILGTGVGGGIVIDGRIVTGANAIAGEWGHNPLPSPQAGDHPLPPCYCGRRGCIETYLSGPGLTADFAGSDGETLDASEIARRAEHGDPKCAAAMDRYQLRLARSLASIINVLDPDVIVLGGGLSNVRLLYANLPVRCREFVFSDDMRTRIVPPMHGDSSGVRGAAWLWDSN